MLMHGDFWVILELKKGFVLSYLLQDDTLVIFKKWDVKVESNFNSQNWSISNYTCDGVKPFFFLILGVFKNFSTYVSNSSIH